MFSKMLVCIELLLTTLFGFPTTLLRYIRRWLHFRRLANRFPGPRPLPLVGNLLEGGIRISANRRFEVMMDGVSEYKTGQFWPGPFRIFFISDPNDIQTYLQNSKNQTKPINTNRHVADFLGDGLITLNGEDWRRHHKIIHPTFNVDHLNTFIKTFDRKCNIFLNLLERHVDGPSFDVKHIVLQLTLDVVLETVLQTPSNLLMDKNTFSRLLEVIEYGQKTLRKRVVRPWLLSSTIFKLSSIGRKNLEELNFFREFIRQHVIVPREVVQERMSQSAQKMEDNSRKRHFYGPVDAMLYQKQKDASISLTEITEQILTLIVAGFDTTAAAVQLALYLLATNPDIQEKVVLELQSLFGESGSAEVTPDTLSKMVYLEMVVKETLRLYPPVWFFLRETGVDTPLVSTDLVLPKDSVVMIPVKCVHSNPELYPDPEVFDPERFSPENSARRHPFAFLPFARGSRSCIAKKYSMMETKTLLAKVLWRYEVHPEPSYTPTFIWGVATLPRNGVWIKLTNRR